MVEPFAMRGGKSKDVKLLKFRVFFDDDPITLKLIEMTLNILNRYRCVAIKGKTITTT